MKITALEEFADFAILDTEKLFTKLKSHKLSRKDRHNHNASLTSNVFVTSTRVGGTKRDNLVVLHSGRTLILRRVLLGLLVRRKQLLQVLDHILQLRGLSLTHRELLVPLM
jgi:hypothetical protein